MNRRDALRAGVGLAALGPTIAAAQSQPSVRTVRGRAFDVELGFVLPHEHVMVDFIGADRVARDRYDADEVFRVVLPHLKQARAAGVGTIVECTPAYLGRDVALLKRLSEASGLHILTNTGYYAAGGGKHLPAHARSEDADQLAARWLKEAREGIDGTDVRPGFIKIGVDKGPLDDVGRKLAHAAARTNRQGPPLTIVAHCGDGVAALEILDLLIGENVPPEDFIWAHAQNEPDGERHARAAERGAWVAFDGVGPETIERHVDLVVAMKRRGRLGRVLVSQDAGWYHVGEPGGGTFRPYDTLLTRFRPALSRAGLTGPEVAKLGTNAQSAFL